MWTTVEVSIGVFAACLPALRPLLGNVPSPKSLYGKLLRTGSSNQSEKTGGDTGRTNSESKRKSEGVPRDVEHGSDGWDDGASKGDGRANGSGSINREMELREIV